jgi:putative peptidoglycan lipid II flippase
MAAGTAVTLVSWPIYALLYHWQGAMGLAVASDVGIALQTGVIALLLHQRRMVSLASLDYEELARCLAAAAAGGGVVWAALWGLGRMPLAFLHAQNPAIIRWTDLGLLLLGCALWAAVARWVLETTGSALPKVAMKRLGLGRAGIPTSFRTHIYPSSSFKITYAVGPQFHFQFISDSYRNRIR